MTWEELGTCFRATLEVGLYHGLSEPVSSGSACPAREAFVPAKTVWFFELRLVNQHGFETHRLYFQQDSLYFQSIFPYRFSIVFR